MPVDVETGSDGVAVVTMNRPGKLNALAAPELEQLGAALRRIRRDPEIKVAILTGAGDRAFTAGMDWNELGETDGVWPGARYYDVPDGLMLDMIPYLKGIEIWKPLLAAVNGHAIALGAHLLIGCDLRVASTNATVAFNETRFGGLADGGAMARLPRQIPYVHAMDLLLTGRRATAEEMLRMGLVNEVVPPERLMPRTLEIARDLAANTDPLAVQFTKRAVVGGLDGGQSQAMLAESLYAEVLHNRHGRTESGMAEMRRRFGKGTP
jgi:enoyl-CoA hydratase/carnithine racemase